MAEAAPPFRTSTDSISLTLILSRLPPGMPLMTYRGPRPASREETPRSWILGVELGSAAAVLVMDRPATLPWSDMSGLLEPCVSRSLEETCVTALEISLLLREP